jgi:hypothetical protein
LVDIALPAHDREPAISSIADPLLEL